MYTNTRQRVYEKLLDFSSMFHLPVAVAVLHATDSDSSPVGLYLCTRALLDPSFSLLMRIRILLLIKGMRICDHWSTGQSIHGSILNLHASILHLEPLQPLNFDFDADPDPPENADPNPASQNAVQDPAS